MADKNKSRQSPSGFHDPQLDEVEVEARGQLNLNSVEDAKTRAGDLNRKPDPSLTKTGFLEKLQRHITAIVYAEAGDFQSAQEFLEPQPRPKSILLVIEGEVPDQAAFSYSLGLCTRMNAELDILQVIQKSNDDGDYQLLSEMMVNGSRNLVDLMRMAEVMKIPFKVTIRIGDVSEKLINYAKRHKDVAMIILDSPRVRKAPRRERTWEKFLQLLSHELSVPITTVLPRGAAIVSH